MRALQGKKLPFGTSRLLTAHLTLSSLSVRHAQKSSRVRRDLHLNLLSFPRSLLIPSRHKIKVSFAILLAWQQQRRRRRHYGTSMTEAIRTTCATDRQHHRSINSTASTITRPTEFSSISTHPSTGMHPDNRALHPSLRCGHPQLENADSQRHARRTAKEDAAR